MAKSTSEKNQERLNKLRKKSPASFLLGDGEQIIEEEKKVKTTENQKVLPKEKKDEISETPIEQTENDQVETVVLTTEQTPKEITEIKNESSLEDNGGNTLLDTPTSNQLTPTPPIMEEADLSISSANIEGSKKKRLAKLKSKAKKVRVEDTHTRKTYLVRNDLLERIENVSNGTHGFKIEFINFAIELALAEYEQIEEEES